MPVADGSRACRELVFILLVCGFAPGFCAGSRAAGGPPGIVFGETPLEAQAPSAPSDFWDRPNLLGDIDGLRPLLRRYGFQINVSETSEVLDNPIGGIRQGAVYEGVTDLDLGWDLRTYFRWRGVFFARAYQIHGRGLSANDLGNLNIASGIEADRTTRLYELWYEQHIGDWLRIRIGEQSAGQEFIISPAAKLFVNSAFGWPTLPGTDLPAGGPNYPVSTPAVRFRVDPADGLTLFAGLFNGNPTGAPIGATDPQRYDPSGTAFRVNDGAFAIAEARYNPEDSPKNGTYRLGAWFNSERFASQDVASNGAPLASPLADGTPRLLYGDYSVYGVVDQPLFPPKGRDDAGGLVAFGRAMGAPRDRNLIDFYVDTGLTYKGPFGRNGDAVGIAFGYARIGAAARAFDAETAAVTGQPYPVRSTEDVVELTYQIGVTPWCQLQPDFQYITNPGGGIVNPTRPGQRIGNAAILGLRTSLTF